MAGRMLRKSFKPFIDQKYHSVRRQFGRPAKRSAQSQWFMRVQSTHAPLRIVFVSTEVAPWSKVGGLADVVSALPMALASRGHKVMTVAPRYEAYPDTKPTGIIIPIRSDQEGDLQSLNRVPECGFMPLCQGNDDLMLSYGKEPHDHATEDAFAELYDVKSNGVVRVFVDHPRLSTGKDIYGQQNNGILTYMESSDAADLDVRYSILCQAALGAAVLHPELNNVPGTLQETSCRDDGDLVFVGNDWPTALLLLHLKHSIQDSQLQQDVLQSETFCNYKKLDGYLNLLRKKLSSASAAMCIHNLAYQGVFSTDIFRRLCLPCTAFAPLSMTQDWKASLAHQHPTKCVIANVGQASNGAPIDDSGNINFLKSALLVCDEIVTVSPSYAKEIQSPEFGCGLNDILSCRGVTGIMNGIDTSEWNPKTDEFLKPEWRFDLQNFDTKKAAIKIALQERIGLVRNSSASLYVFIGRLTEQKGVDVLLAALPMVFLGSPAPSPRKTSPEPRQKVSLQSTDQDLSINDRRDAPMIQVAMLGTGDSWMERSLECLSLSFPGYAAGLALFSEEMAHLMLAAADYVIIPSRFEPCGLIAQCALRYGTVPIVTAVGGLKDLVTPDIGHVLPRFNCANNPVGQQEDVNRVSDMIKQTALECGSESHRKLQVSCMSKDLSWEKPAEEWEELLIRVAKRRKVGAILSSKS